MTNSWKSGQSGSWTDPSAWSAGIVPGGNANVLVAAAPAIAGLPYVVGLQGSAAVHAIRQMQAAATLDVSAGTLGISGTYTLAAGTLRLDGATLQGGTFASTAGTVLLKNSCAVSGVSVHGTLSLQAGLQSYANVNLLSDIFTGTGGTGPGALVLGTGVSAELGTNPTLGAMTVTLNGASLQQVGGTLTLGAACVVDTTASSTLGGSNAFINRGQLSTDGSSSLLIVDATTLLNQGTIALGSGANMLLQTTCFDNTGLVSIGTGSYLRVTATGAAGLANTGSIAVNGGTLSLDAALTTAQLEAFSVVTGTLAIGGALDNRGAVLRTGSTLANILLEGGGSITGGTIVNTGYFSIGNPPASIVNPQFAQDSALSGITVDGPLDIAGAYAKLDVSNGLIVNGVAGSGPGTINLDGAGADLTFLGNQTIDNVQINLGDAAPQDYQTEGLLWSGSSALTLGAHAAVIQTGTSARIDRLGGLGAIANLGKITAAVSGGSLSVDGLANSGLLAISNGDTVSLSNSSNAGTVVDSSAQLFLDDVHNSGLITVSGLPGSPDLSQNLISSGLDNTGVLSVSSGATASLGGSWTNSGIFAVSDGEISVGGSFGTAQLGRLKIGAGGTLGLAGTLVNTATLSIGTGSALPVVALQSFGAIQGGTVADAGGGLLAQGGTLSGVTYQGVLSLAAANAKLSILGGLSVIGPSGGAGRIAVTGAGSELMFATATLDRVAVLLGGSGAGGTLASFYNTVLTLGAQAMVQQAGAAATIGRPYGYVVNAGHIAASQAGGTLSLLGSFSNAGTVAVSNGNTLLLDVQSLASTGLITASSSIVDVVQLTAAELALVRLTNSTVDVTGTLTATGSMLSVGAGGSIPLLKLSGAIAGGTIHDAGGGVQFAGASTLDGVSYLGTLVIDRPFAAVTVLDGLALSDVTGRQPGSLSLTGAGAQLDWNSTLALDNAAIAIGSASAAYGAPAIVGAAGGTHPVLLGAHLKIQQTGAYAAIGTSTGTYVSAATLGANLAHGQFTLGGSSFTNTGTIGIMAGDTVSAAAAAFTNTGLIVLGVGSALDLTLNDYCASGSLAAQSFTNAGSITMAGGTLIELNDGGTLPNVPLLNAPGARISGAGVVASQVVNNGLIDARGTLNLVQAVSGTGILQVDPGATLVLAGVGHGQSVRFAGSGGVLGLQPPAFLGSIGGFAAGDTIDLFDTAARSAAFSGNTLDIVLDNGSMLHLATNTALTGALSVTAGSHGDALIRYAAASAHAVWRTDAHLSASEAGLSHFAHAF